MWIENITKAHYWSHMWIEMHLFIRLTYEFIASYNIYNCLEKIFCASLDITTERKGFARIAEPISKLGKVAGIKVVDCP